ncbi:hypothetical protein GGTG_03121 [Gaeumannomyces tritici R3-111a-1]|uniref:Uncharacterized protein n=1 Tax=Gaeumannomyces tritici (strain R3-111a-1) TaxID=644352 RepID=J3NPB3_GAET3|nr:hypothetical protein GGTG_03121 [Gaeumannomyces tritici R3-111a-1]EJT78018.1 hypothetical protein GGTG_03121 [Gaeumannomyces tritici R3-111a-1]
MGLFFFPRRLRAEDPDPESLRVARTAVKGLVIKALAPHCKDPPKQPRAFGLCSFFDSRPVTRKPCWRSRRPSCRAQQRPVSTPASTAAGQEDHRRLVRARSGVMGNESRSHHSRGGQGGYEAQHVMMAGVDS